MNKKLEQFIKQNIDLEFENITNKLIKYQDYPIKRKNNHLILKICTSLSIFIFIVGISFKTPKKDYNIININEINYISDYLIYENNTANSTLIDESKIKKISNINELSKIFNYDFNLDENNLKYIECSYKKNTIDQCQITYSTSLINVKKDIYPNFSTEISDNWDNNITNLNTSLIDKKEIIIIKDLTEEKYKTKFIINNIGISIESTNIEEFKSYIEKIIICK